MSKRFGACEASFPRTNPRADSRVVDLVQDDKKLALRVLTQASPRATARNIDHRTRCLRISRLPAEKEERASGKGVKGNGGKTEPRRRVKAS